ncbi:MAG: antibiotic biosynthesis monooxygenase, partial [Proteobacteria bacterium]|nr:antibiotic biosynthesis monooxygenase [Pseudomonadota bacterium]
MASLGQILEPVDLGAQDDDLAEDVDDAEQQHAQDQAVEPHVGGEGDAERVWKEECAPLMIRQKGCRSEKFMRSLDRPELYISYSEWDSMEDVERYRSGVAEWMRGKDRRGRPGRLASGREDALVRSFYGFPLERFIQAFGRQRVFIQQFEKLEAEP